MFNSLSRKFQRWQEAELLDEKQVNAILQFERNRKAGRLTRYFARVGIIAIILGMISLIASNWDGILLTWKIMPPLWKIIGHFILNFAIAFAVFRIDGDKHPYYKDGAIALLAGFFLSFIALIGQIFQLHGDLHNTLFFWLAICTPFIWYYGRSFMIASPWLTLAIITLYLNIIVHLEDTPHQFWIVASLIAFYLPSVLLLLARSPLMQLHKDGFSRAFAHMGAFLPALFANIALFLFYDHSRMTDHTGQILLFILGLVGIFLLFRPHPPKYPLQNLRCYLLASNILIALPFIVAIHNPLIPCILFLFYWAFLAWLGARLQSDSLTTWAIRLIILRLFIAYIEVFGNLLTTGLGLIFSGILLLILLRSLNRITLFARKFLGHE